MSITDLDFDSLFAITPTPLMVLDTSLRFVAANHCYLSVTARKLEDLVGRFVFDAFPDTPERQELMRGFFEAALAGEENSQAPHPFAIVRPDGGYQDVWWMTHQLPIHNATGKIIGVLQHCRDMSDEVNAKRMRDVISTEYDHRVRNMLAKVSAVARRSAHSAGSLQQFIADFDPRIAAMARAHELLVHGGWERLGLGELVAGELQPYVGRIDGQLSTSGPNVPLSSHVAQALGMALHELATNAAKYGALSQPEGHLDVHWSLGASDGALRLVWTETGTKGGSSQPQQSGFGSTIIDRVLPAETGGAVSRAFKPGGMVCTVEIPVPTRS
ncbi:MAG: PAS domain-containing protein [Sandarakinorhabdus sp.]|nr:PAS domain-containing protein [Sandarakinorhabdus sp.]